MHAGGIPEGGGGRRKKGQNKGNVIAVGDGTGNPAVEHPGKNLGFASAVLANEQVLQAVQVALTTPCQWQDAKAIGHALVGLRVIAVRLMSGGEVHQALRESHAAAAQAPQHCIPVIKVVWSRSLDYALVLQLLWLATVLCRH